MYNIDLSPELEADLSTILKKVPLLHGEMITKTHALEGVVTMFLLFIIFCSKYDAKKDTTNDANGTSSTYSQG